MTTTKSHDKNHILQEYVGEELLTLSQKRRYLCVPLPHGGHFILFQYCTRSLNTPRTERVQIVCDHNQFLLVTSSKACRATADTLDVSADGYSQFYRFCKGLLDTDVDQLIALEDRIYAFEDGLLTSRKESKTAAETIVTMRRSLLHIKRYYQQVQLIVAQLGEEDSGLAPELVSKFNLLSSRLTQLADTVQALQQAVSECSETYQAQIGIQQNNLMKVFTVITTIFMPLTVIVGWYGMNFDGMPELHWQYGYLYVIGLSAVVCGISALIFKLKKWFD